jgi:hypothetical protein
MNNHLNELKKKVGSRIRQARVMAGYVKIADLSDCFPDWSDSRLGNYETGTSLPSPIDIERIAKETDSSPCWIMFGIGSIRSASRDIQAVRHQNLTQLYKKLPKANRSGLRAAIKLKPNELTSHLNNPFLKLTDTLCRNVEKHIGKPKGWMDEQQIDNDGLCDYFPDDIRELMTIYSDLDNNHKSLLLEMAKVFKNHN